MITFEQVLADLQEIAASKPEGYKYTDDPEQIEKVRQNNPDWVNDRYSDDVWIDQCLYRNPDDSPGCIIGHLLLKYAPDYRPQEMNTATMVMNASPVKFAQDAIEFAQSIQTLQDARFTWDDAIQQSLDTHDD